MTVNSLDRTHRWQSLQYHFQTLVENVLIVVLLNGWLQSLMADLAVC